MSMPLDDYLARYRLLRARQYELNSKITARLSDYDMKTSSRDIGVLQGSHLMLSSESLMDVLLDYCVYKKNGKGKNAIDKYIEANPPDEDSLDKALLTAMTQSRYSIFLVEGLERGYGLRTQDLLFGENGFIVDVNMSKSAAVNQGFAGRILPVDPSFSMSSGAFLPLDNVAIEFLKKVLLPKYMVKKGEISVFLEQNIQQFEAELITQLIRNGVGEKFKLKKLR